MAECDTWQGPLSLDNIDLPGRGNRYAGRGNASGREGLASGYPTGNTRAGKRDSHAVERGARLTHSEKAQFNLGLGQESAMKC